MWVRHRCQDVPGRVAPIAATSPARPSDATSCTPGQAAGREVAEEGQCAVLGGGDLQAQDFAVTVGVDTGGYERVHVDDTAALTDLQHQGVGGPTGRRRPR